MRTLIHRILVEKRLAAAASILSAFLAGPAAAADGPAVVSGGIGETEQAQLAAREGQFNLKLVFSLVQGNYVSDVDVRVTDARGAPVLLHLAGGPFLMARLPPGRYRVAAIYEGRTVTRDVTVSSRRLATEYLRWPADPDNDLPVSRWLEPGAVAGGGNPR